METKFTKGEWKIYEYDNGACSIHNEEKGKEIACLHYGSMMLNKDELKANAKLIAAAPDLLEASAFAYSIIEKHKDDIGILGFRLDNGRIIQIDEVLKKLEKAIKKATE